MVEKIAKSGHQPNEMVTLFADGSVFYGASSHMPDGEVLVQQKLWLFGRDLINIKLRKDFE